MAWNFNNDTPLFQQIAKALEDDIFLGLYKEGEQIPSTTELSTTLKINPATVLKGMNLLVDQGLIEKKRGLGMFVCTKAKERIMDKRRKDFSTSFILPLLKEAEKLELRKEDLIEMIRKEAER